MLKDFAAPLVHSFGLSDRGRVRPNNEDQFLIAELAKSMLVQQSSLPQPHTQYGDERGHLFVVADGMGGHAGGEEASALALGSIEDFALNTLKWFFHLEGGEGQHVLGDLQNALRQADARIFQETTQHPELRGMGTTVTLAYTLGTALFVMHVGDSRCYLLRTGRLHRLTSDHTVAQEMVTQGLIAPEAVAHHQFRHMVTNVVGGDREGLRVEMHKLDLIGGDVVMVASDGLTDMVSDEQITAVLAVEPDPRGACTRLVTMANEAGGRDNITVIVARFEATPPTASA